MKVFSTFVEMGLLMTILKTLSNGKYQWNKMRGIYLPRYGAGELLLILTHFKEEIDHNCESNFIYVF